MPMQMSEKQHDNIVIDFADDDSNENTGRHDPSFHLEFTSFSEKNEMMMISKRYRRQTSRLSRSFLPCRLLLRGYLSMIYIYMHTYTSEMFVIPFYKNLN